MPSSFFRKAFHFHCQRPPLFVVDVFDVSGVGKQTYQFGIDFLGSLRRTLATFTIASLMFRLSNTGEG